MVAFDQFWLWVSGFLFQIGREPVYSTQYDANLLIGYQNCYTSNQIDLQNSNQNLDDILPLILIPGLTNPVE